MPDASGAVVVTDRRHSARRELRDPSAATISTGFRSRGMPMVPEWDAENAIRWGYLSNTIVYRAVSVIASALSRVPFRAGADPDKPQDYDKRATTGLARLLSPPPYGPNAETSARQLWAWTVAQYLVTGRFGWENELALRSDQVVALWPLPSTGLRAIPTGGGGRYFERFEFGPPRNAKRLTAEQVTYGWRPSATDWREPESALQAARLDVSVAVMQDRYDYAFLRNGARPDFLIVHEAIDDPDERAAFRDQWNSNHRGPDNAGKPAFVESEGGEGGVGQAIDVKQLGLSQRDAQALERHKHKINLICMALGTPLSKLGDSSSRTFNNAGQENRNWWEDTVLPLGEELADIVNIKLAPRLGDNVGWFDWSKVPALSDRPALAQIDVPKVYAQRLATKNEGRRFLGLPEVEGGDEFLAEPEPPAPVAEPETPATPATPELVVVPEQPTGTDRARGQEHREQEHDDPLAAALARRDARWAAVNSRAESLEKAWERGFRRLFERQEKSTLTRLTGKRGRQMLRDLTAAAAQRAADDPAPQVDPADIFDASFWADDTAEMSAVLYETVATVAGSEVLERFGLSFDLDAPYVQDFIAARAKQLAGQVTDTTYAAIRQALAQGVLEGASIDDLADAVRHVFDVASNARATVIARTEVISAFNGAGALSAAQLPEDVVAAQEWIATRDPRVREAHADADGQVVRIGQPFTVAGEALAYPGDPSGSGSNTIQCRCTIGFLTPDEVPDDLRRREVDRRTAELAILLARDVEPDELRARLRVVA